MRPVDRLPRGASNISSAEVARLEETIPTARTTLGMRALGGFPTWTLPARFSNVPSLISVVRCVVLTRDQLTIDAGPSGRQLARRQMGSPIATAGTSRVGLAATRWQDLV